MKKLRIGILFGGRSKEKEVSFASGRTVYDNLDRNLYIPVPIFITEKNEFIRLKWEYLYKGSIKDFYPCEEENIGEKISIEDLKNIIDIAFLALHGKDGEDGHIQGVLEWLDVPYTGSKILGSTLGISKFVQKEIMKNYGYKLNKYRFLYRYQWLQEKEKNITDIKNEFSFPFIVKSANQGSSIGVNIVYKEEKLEDVIDASFGILRIKKIFGDTFNEEQKYNFLTQNLNGRHEYGFPVVIENQKFYEVKNLLSYVESNLDEELLIHSLVHDEEVLIEEFIRGREFSCIVLQEKERNPQALFPTEIIKKIDIFDYQGKYLPGGVKKITPMPICDEVMEKIRTLSVRLFKDLHFGVFGRMEGFVTEDNEIILNDANTITGMEQISILFQQAAYANLSPKQLLNFIIQNSL
ncbi:MAG: hypothetical protein LBD32_02935 [Cytophagales bacterium]|jgi:D-alanine-D-alanine ligase|nr:hypothetical protein [Cytophagales bacterium]